MWRTTDGRAPELVWVICNIGETTVEFLNSDLENVYIAIEKIQWI